MIAAAYWMVFVGLIAIVFGTQPATKYSGAAVAIAAFLGMLFI